MSSDELCRQVARLMQSNLVTVGPHRYTRPAPSTYEHQWLWDSCFHAVIYCHLDPAMARDELLSLIVHQVAVGPDAGMIPHMVYWHGGGEGLWGQPESSTITQPPLIAIAALRVYRASADRDWMARLYPALCAYHRWFDVRRDPDGDHLVSLIHPWESGWDASPRWDAPMGLTDPTDKESQGARVALVGQLARYDYDAQRIAQAGLFCVESVDFNAIRAADLESLADIAELLGLSHDANEWRTKAKSVKAAMRKMWDDTTGTFQDLSGVDESFIEVDSAAPFVTLFGGVPTGEQAQRLVSDLLS